MPNDTYQNTPVSRNARKKLFRQARLGTRPVPLVLEVGDAVKSISVTAAYRDGWTSDTNELPMVVKNAWAARKDA